MNYRGTTSVPAFLRVAAFVLLAAGCGRPRYELDLVLQPLKTNAIGEREAGRRVTHRVQAPGGRIAEGWTTESAAAKGPSPEGASPAGGPGPVQEAKSGGFEVCVERASRSGAVLQVRFHDGATTNLSLVLNSPAEALDAGGRAGLRITLASVGSSPRGGAAGSAGVESAARSKLQPPVVAITVVSEDAAQRLPAALAVPYSGWTGTAYRADRDGRIFLTAVPGRTILVQAPGHEGCAIPAAVWQSKPERSLAVTLEPRRTVAEWKALARSDEVALRDKALAALAAQEPDEPETVIGLLRDERAGIRKSAVRSLVRHGWRRENLAEAVPALIALLREEDAETRGEAILALRDLGPAAGPAVPTLVGLLRDGDGHIRGLAAQALEKIGPEATGAIPALAEVIRVRKKDMQDLAFVSAWGALSKMGPEGRKAGTAALLEMLRNPDENELMRNGAAAALERMKPEARAAIPDLAGLLRHEDAGIRRTAAWALGFVRPDEQTAVPALIGLLRDSDPDVRRITAWSLGRGGAAAAKAAVPALAELLQDKDPLMQASAAEALANLGPDTRGKGVAALAGLLRHEDALVREAAARCLRAKGPVAGDAVPALTGALRDESPDVREGAAVALGDMGAAAKPAIAALADLLKDTNEDVRAAAASALAKIGPDATAAVPALTGVLQNDSADRVRQMADYALRRIQEEGAAGGGGTGHKADPEQKGAAAADTNAVFREPPQQP